MSASPRKVPAAAAEAAAAAAAAAAEATALASAEKEATRRERAEKLHKLLSMINLDSLRRRYSSTQSASGSDNGYMSARSISAHPLSPRDATGNRHVFDELALVDAAASQDYWYALRESEEERM